MGLESLFLKLSPILSLSTVYAFYRHGLYKSQRFPGKFDEIISLVKGNISGVIGFVIILYFFSDEKVSRLTILIYFAISTVGFIILRFFMRNLIRITRKKGHNLRQILLVGNSKQLVEYVQTAKYFKDSGIRILGWIDSGGLANENDIRDINQSYEDYKKTNSPHSVVLSYRGEDGQKVSTFLKTHYNDVVPIQLLPDLSYSLVGHRIKDFGGIPLLLFNQPSLNPIELFFKRLIEFFLTAMGIIVIFPLLVLISILVKLSSKGPILYGQERIGLHGQKFKMWKFRSMKMAASDNDSKEWSNRENPRKTKVGELLRKTSLDELPQLWNVLKGEMSLVGPRPEQPFFVEKFKDEIPGYMLKHKMKPGITGWAQVNGWRGDTSLHKRIECDIYYIKNWSLIFDFKIIFLTFFKGFVNKNAY